ncbi:MAG TPA: invasin domain 3-containing protein [Bryobacteraceae bacterium]|nr:invasin domain 3-containing protein [Bryobacteraceae bacterium]
MSTLTFAAAANTAPGSYPIALQGASGTLIHSMSITLTVMGTPDFTLSASPASVSTNVGNSVMSKITVSGINAFSGAVSFTASGMPAGVTAAFAPASVTGSGTTTLTLTASASTAGGTYPITVQGASASLLHSTTVTLTIATPDFTLSVSPPAVVVASGGGSATSTITVGALNGFTGSVNLTSSGLPAGVGVSFAPPSVSGAGSSVLTITTSTGAPAGSFNVNLQGASGNLLHSTSLVVTSQPAILLPANVSVFPGSSVPYPVSLGSPASNNVYVTLTSSDTSKVTLSAATVLFQAGSATPSVTPKLNGVNFGSATITASAWTYAPASQTVSVTDALSFSPGSVSIGQGASQFLTLILSAPLSANLTVNLSSDNPAVATVPATVTLPANTTSASIRVSGVAGGSTVIHANALPSIPDTTATVKVGAALTIVTTALGNGSVSAFYSQTLSANGGTAPLTWALTSGTLPNGLTLTPTTGQITGTPTSTVTNTPLTFKVTDASFPAQTATTSLTLTITAGGPSAASVAAAKGTPQSATVNTVFSVPLVAMAKDGMGNPVSGVVVTFSAPSTGATGTFATGLSTTVATDVTGSASAVFTANGVAGSYSVTASISGVATPATFALTNLAGPAARISLTSGSGQSASVNTAFAAPLAVMVSDAGGNPVSGAKVTFMSPTTGASASFAGGTMTITTNPAGVASAPVTANGTPGTYTVTATVPGVASPASFSLTNIGPAASITAVSGGNQSAPINSTFSNPLVVKVVDAAGDPVSGVTVVLSAPGTGASGVFGGSSMVTTNSSGMASSPAFTANSIAGSYVVTASVAGVGNPAMFSLTNLSGIILPAVTAVAPGSSTPFPITLGVPAPSNGVFIALTSSDTSKVTISGANIFVPGGSTIPTLIPKINGINLGSVIITATAWNYQPVSQQLQVNEGIGFFPGSATMSAGSIQYVTLTLSAPAPANLTVNLTSDTPSVATAPATVTFPANTTSTTVRLTGVAPGSATITASAPNVTPAGIPVTVK